MSRIARAAAALLFACGFGAPPVASQGIAKQFAISLGRTIPTGDFHADSSGEGFDGGWTAAARVALKRSRSPLELRIEAVYSGNGANDRLKSDLTTRFAQATDETVTLVGADAVVVYELARGRRVTPRVFGGVGLSHVSIAITSGGVTMHNASTNIAWNIGGEFAYRALFLEVRYVSVAPVTGFPRTAFVPISVGVEFRPPGP